MIMFLCKLLSRASCLRLQKMSSLARPPLPNGVWPTMITPFLNDGKKSVDWKGLDVLTDWYIRSGCTGLFSVCLSSEMFQLTNQERVDIAKHVVQKAAGRVPVVAGATFEGSLEEQAELMNEIGKVAQASVIITNQIAQMEESDEIWIKNAQKLLDMTGDISLGIYETPVPQCRSLTPEMLTWAAKTGRFVFHKDTSLSINLMLSKLQAVQAVPDTPLKFFTAKVQFLKALLDNNGNGYSGIDPNFLPWVVVELCKTRGDEEEKRRKLHQFLAVCDRVFAHKYPASSKVYLRNFYNVPINPVCRTSDAILNEQDEVALANVKSLMEELCDSFNIKPVLP